MLFRSLENEQPLEAERLFRELIRQVPDDPLGYANLAVSALRQQKFEEALEWTDKALERAPGRAQLLAIRAEGAARTARRREHESSREVLRSQNLVRSYAFLADVERATHHHLLPRSDDVHLHIDHRQSGVGNGSCGPGVLEAYKVPAVTTTWRWAIAPLVGGADPFTVYGAGIPGGAATMTFL